MWKLTVGFTVLCLAYAFDGDRPDFSGKWRLQDAKAGAATLQIEQSEDEIRIVDTGEKTDVKCNTVGKECAATVEGQPAKVTFYYNGPMLVEMRNERDGKRFVKTRRKLSADGRTMSVEIMPINPAGSSKEMVFVKDGTAESGK